MNGNKTSTRSVSNGANLITEQQTVHIHKVKTKIAAQIELGDLKRKSVRGGAVTLLSQAVSTVVHLASTVILARLLTPADYGIIAMVTAITSFAGLFRDLGLSSAAIQKKDLTTGQQTNLFWLNIAMGTALTVLVATCSPLVSWFYAKPELTAVTVALSFNFIIGSFGSQHRAMLVRNMQFARKALAEITGAIISLIVAVSFAYHGYSYWALAASSLTGTIITTTLLFLISPFWPGLPGRGRGIRQMVSFGVHVTAFDIINYFHRNLDNILIGRIWGIEALGIYSKAYEMLMFPIQAIRGPINSVAFPAMSKIANEKGKFVSYARNLIYVTATLSMPIVAFLFCFTDQIISVVLGPKWAGVSPVFSALAIASFIQPVCGIRGIVLYATGNGKRLIQWGVINSVCTGIAFTIGVAWGPVGVAFAYVLVSYMLLIPSLMLVFHETPLSLSDFFESIYHPAIFSTISGAIAFAASKTIPTRETYQNLICTGLIYAAVYSSLLIATKQGRKTLAIILKLFKSIPNESTQ